MYQPQSRHANLVRWLEYDLGDARHDNALADMGEVETFITVIMQLH